MHYSFSFTNQIDQSFLLAKFYQKIHGWFVPENKSFFEGLVVSCSAIIDFLCFDSEKMRYMLVHTFSIYCCLFFTCFVVGDRADTDVFHLTTVDICEAGFGSLILSPCSYYWSYHLVHIVGVAGVDIVDAAMDFDVF